MRVHGLPVYHLVAKLERPDISLAEFEIASWCWERLRAAFPLALAVCLMPDHPHIVTPLEDPDAARIRINRLLGHLARRVGVRYLGEAAAPSLIADRQKLARDLRYVALNPPRAGLVSDPLEWLFSTHRDVVGATVDPWIDARRLALALGRREEGFVESYHRYVSSDPSVKVGGTPLPQPAIASNLPQYTLDTIARAAAAATRTPNHAIRNTGITRDVFVALAREHGWRSWDALASACGCSTRAIRRSAVRELDLAAPRLCLGDPRLLWPAARRTSGSAAAPAQTGETRIGPSR